MGKKGEETYQKILMAAMQSLDRYGDKNTTFQSISEIAGVSQPLVAKYFKSREAVLPAVVDKFLQDARVATAGAVEKARSPREKLKEYLHISIKMFRDKPEIFKVYLLLHYYAGFDDKFKKENTEIKRVAVDRVAKIIDDGIAINSFRKCNSKLAAKIIHSALVGVVLGITTENQTFTDQQLEKALDELVSSYLEPA